MLRITGHRWSALVRECPMPLFMRLQVHTSPDCKSYTHYQALEVPHDATQSEIKTAYYKLTLKFHPDKNQTEAAKKRFQEISDAYEVLSNHNARRQYDRQLAVKMGNIEVGRTKTNAAPAKNDISKYQSEFMNPSAFDTWASKHYEHTIDKHRYKNMQFNVAVKSAERQFKPEDPYFPIGTYILCVAFFLLLMVMSLYYDKGDYPPPKYRKKSQNLGDKPLSRN